MPIYKYKLAKREILKILSLKKTISFYEIKEALIPQFIPIHVRRAIATLEQEKILIYEGRKGHSKNWLINLNRNARPNFTQRHPKGEENLDTTENAECYCPTCHKIHERILEVDYIMNPDIWRQDGRIVMWCKKCKRKEKKDKDKVLLAVMEMRKYNRINNNGGGIQ